MVDTWVHPPEQSCSEEESTMTIIATRDLSKGDVPQGDFNWSTFSKFALTFDPLRLQTSSTRYQQAQHHLKHGPRWHYGTFSTVGSASEIIRET